MADLKKQVETLTAMLKSMQCSPRPSYAAVAGPRYSPQQPQRQPQNLPANRDTRQGGPRQLGQPQLCYTCNSPGHIARFCPRGIVCYGCGGTGHIRNACPNQWRTQPEVQARRQYYRRLLDEDQDDTTSNKAEDGALDEEEEPVACNVVHKDVGPRATSSKTQQRRQQWLYSPSHVESECAAAWTRYVTGDGQKPKMLSDAKTLISASHSEPARNKPIVEGRCAGVKTRIFLDSGAEINVLDSAFLSTLMAKGIQVPFTPTKASVQCANGSKMDVTGFAQVDLHIGCVRATQKFHVVRNVFPRIIVGIRSMKTMDIALNPREDCAFVHNMKVPFISTVVPQSVAAGNASGTHSRAEVSPMNARLQ